MSTSRSIRIATGIKRIELGNANLAPLQIRDILQEHRGVLIDSLMADLKTYIDYKFSKSASKDQLEEIKNKLVALKGSALDLAMFGPVIDGILQSESIHHVKSDLFYREINNTIMEELNPSQLQIVR